jgi:N-acetylglucosamine-6-phosphate deacetylase
MRLGVRAALVDGEVVAGDVTIEEGAVTAVGASPAGSLGTAVPGFVDAHINGISGVDFLSADEQGYRRAREALAATGVVAFQPTFVSSPQDAYRERLALAGALPADGLPEPLGVHLEGPFLAPAWAGAHDPAHLLPPNRALAAGLCDAGPVTMMTVAPELPGGLELVRMLAARGVVVSLGHSDADAAAAHAAFGAGARAITHVHNAHRRWRPRDPGLAGVALVRPDARVQAIVDGVHLAPESAYGAFLAAHTRFCLVTDAVEAAGLGQGSYRLGGRTVLVADGAVRLQDGTLAGSLLTMDQAVRNLVAAGAGFAGAVHAASTAPAGLLGRGDLGLLRPRAPAHIAVLDDELRVLRTVVGGVEAFRAAA